MARPIKCKDPTHKRVYYTPYKKGPTSYCRTCQTNRQRERYHEARQARS